jgi:hypothetical protein
VDSTVETTMMGLEDGVVNNPPSFVRLNLSDSSPLPVHGGEAPSPLSFRVEGHQRGSGMHSQTSRQLYPMLLDDNMEVEGARACNTLVTFLGCHPTRGPVLSKPNTTQHNTIQLEVYFFNS